MMQCTLSEPDHILLSSQRVCLQAVTLHTSLGELKLEIYCESVSLFP